jgi:hypothetical protein
MNKTTLLYMLIIFLNTITVISAPKKLILVEEFTGTWCRECGEFGKPTMDTLIEKYGDNMIAVELHQSWTGKFDPMGMREADTLAGHFIHPDLPSASFDRRWFFQFSSWSIGLEVDMWDSAMNILVKSDYIPVDLKLNCIVDTSTRNLTAKIEADFLRDVNSRKDAELRFNVYVLEDNIVYPQSGNDSNYHHMNVCRAFLGGCWGVPGIIPDSVKAGQSYDYTFEYTLDPSWNINNIHFVGFVNGYHSNDGMALKILNCVRGNVITDVKYSKEYNNPISLKAKPNPATDNISLQFSIDGSQKVNIDIHNILGVKIDNIYEGYAQNGVNNINYKTTGLSPGIYIIKLQSGCNIKFQKIIKQ